MITNEAELALARAAELRTMESEAKGLADQLVAGIGVSGAEATDILSALGPLDQAKMREFSEEIKALAHCEVSNQWRDPDAHRALSFTILFSEVSMLNSEKTNSKPDPNEYEIDPPAPASAFTFTKTDETAVGAGFALTDGTGGGNLTGTPS